MMCIVLHSHIEDDLARANAVDLVCQRLGRRRVCEEVPSRHIDPCYADLLNRVSRVGDCKKKIVVVRCDEILI
jgi:hypothetical protein